MITGALEQAVDQIVQNCAMYEEECRRLKVRSLQTFAVNYLKMHSNQATISSKADKWSELLESYTRQDHEATDINESLEQSMQDLQSASTAISELVKEAHYMEGKILPVEDLLVQVERDVAATREHLVQLRKALPVEANATATRTIANAKARRWSAVLYTSIVLGSVFLVVWAISLGLGCLFW